MSCSICSGSAHDARNCDRARRCSNCNKLGHYVSTCSEPDYGRVCSNCGASGHNRSTCARAPRPHPLERNVDRIEDIGMPIGPRFKDMSRQDGWIDGDLTSHDWKSEAYEVLRRLRSYERFRPAFSALVAAAHKASLHTLYVGRAGAHPDHLFSRFQSHRAERGARFMRPVILVPTEFLRDEQWETVAIRWMKRRAAEGSLCCNNTAADHRGQWPSTDETVIYLVSCRRRPGM